MRTCGNANEQIARLPKALVMDCQALFDGVSRSESSALGLSDKRSALEAMALQISLILNEAKLSWQMSLRRAQDQVAPSLRSS